MKTAPLSTTTMRVSRLLSGTALFVSLVVLGGWAFDVAPLRPLIPALMTPQTALCISLLALAALLSSLQPRWTRSAAQVVAAAAAAVALEALLRPWLLASPYGLRTFAAPFPGGIAHSTSLVCLVAALAVALSPLHDRLGVRLSTASAGVGLFMIGTSLVGLLLGSPTLASFGLDRLPSAAAHAIAALVILATLTLRGDAGWVSVLLGPSAAGSSARGIIAWTILAPLTFAALALAGVRAGLYTLHFAFALLAATMCCGLTWLVMWNAARVERAQRRAASAREAMQLAANRLRLAKTATGILMWEWLPGTREWVCIDGEERLDPSGNEYLETGLARCLRDGKAEFEFPMHDDSWMLATCWRELRDRQPVIVGITMDITARKHAALALEASETRLQLAALALPGFVYDWNCRSGKILRTSGIEQILGYRGSEISPVSRWWEDLVHAEDRALSLPARVLRAADSAHDIDSIACEYRVRHRDGRFVWIWDHCVLTRDRAGSIVRVVGSVLDITERKEAEARLATSEHRFKAALLATAGIIWTHSRDGRAVGEQTSWSAFTGQSSEELQGMGWIEALHPDDVQPTLDAWAQAIGSGTDLVTVQRVRRRDGVYRTFSVHAVPVSDERGEIVEWVGSHTDITEQRAAEQQVRDSLQRLETALDAERAARGELNAAAHAKDEFLATISHELRTPLNAILGWTTLLQRPRVAPAMIQDGLKVIERNARAQTQLLGDLLDANQLMSGKLSLTFEPMDFNDAVRATLDSMRVTIAARKIRIECSLSEEPLPVMGDSVRLQQIVSNLLSNAIKFTPADGVIEIATGVQGDMTCCEVRDSGEGISVEFLPHIFEKFRQADVGSARRFAGLGLGLAITRQLVESHGGSISVDSEGRGKGAKFTVRVPPLVPGDGEVAIAHHHFPTRQTDKPLAGLTILAVDDEADSREYLQRLLAEQGAEIVSVSSASEALDELAADSGRFNLLVSDIGMPGSTGYDLIEAVRQRLKVNASDLPAVALTAFTRPQDRDRALDKGFQKHLAKPVQVGRLIGAIRQLTGAAAGGTPPRRH
ncbi:MAG: PAS domain-containing protein [Pseudomonadota bacterium]